MTSHTRHGVSNHRRMDCLSNRSFHANTKRKCLSSTPLFLCDLSRVRDGVLKWKHFPRNWPFVWGIHRSPVNSPHKGQWRGALIFSLIFSLMCAWINGWVNNREADDLRRHRRHYYVTVMWNLLTKGWPSPAYFHYKTQPCGKHFHVYRVSTCWYADMLIYA